MRKIIRDRPMPDPAKPVGNVRYPFAKMQIGDCIAAGNDAETARRTRSAAAKYAAYRNAGERFSTRKDGDQWFVWRIS